jgi:hypothetical protein
MLPHYHTRRQMISALRSFNGSSIYGIGVPVVGVQKTTIRPCTIKGEEENEVTFHVYRGQNPLVFSPFSVESCLRKWFSSTLSVMGITPAEVSQRALVGSQQIQSLVKDRRFLFQYCGNPKTRNMQVRVVQCRSAGAFSSKGRRSASASASRCFGGRWSNPRLTHHTDFATGKVTPVRESQTYEIKRRISRRLS